jgi:hypothetical protein
MSAAKNRIMSRSEIKSTLLLEYGSYGKIGKLAGFTRSYAFECLTGVKNGSLNFWEKVLPLLAIDYEPQFKALQLMMLVHPKEQ